MNLVLSLLGGLLNIIGPLAGRVLLYLGIAFVTYTGFNFGADWLLNQIKANFSAMPADVVSFLAWLWVDKSIGLLFSAYTAAIGVKMAGGTELTKMVTKK